MTIKFHISFNVILRTFNFSIVTTDIKLSIRETARYQRRQSRLRSRWYQRIELAHRNARYASLNYKSTGQNMRYAFENSFSMLSGFFGLTARQSKHSRSVSRRVQLVFAGVTTYMTMEDIRVYSSRKFEKIYANSKILAKGKCEFFLTLKSITRPYCVSGICQRYGQTPRSERMIKALLRKLQFQSHKILI